VTTQARRLGLALALRVAAMLLLALVVAGHPWPSERARPTVFVLADRSASVAAEPARVALEEVLEAARGSAHTASVQLIEFAEGPSAAASRSGTNIESAVVEALQRRTADSPAAIVVLSDGRATAGDTRRALRAARTAGTTVLWRTLAADASTPHIVELFAPRQAQPGQDIPVRVRLAERTGTPLVLSLVSRVADATDRVESTLEAGDRATMEVLVRARVPGTLVLDAELREAASGRLLDAWASAAVVDVAAPDAVMYVAAGPRPLAQSLKAGGWSVTRIEPSALDAAAPGLDAYAAVVLDDVPATAAREATWSALDAAVRERGTGLLVLGGPHSFAAGGYRDSTLESLLPVRSRPAGLGDAAAVVFVVDKSGSMGETAAGVDRFRLAQRAVTETAATLAERDSAALVLFDAEPRVLLPLQSSAGFRDAVMRPWPAQPRGGTRLAPALESALEQLAGSFAPRRIVVLVTDGFVDAAPDESLRSRLAAAAVELVALGVGPDADTAALRPFFPPERSTVLHVGQAAELPSVMRAGLESRRAPVERGRIAVREVIPLPFLRGGTRDWPAVAAYDVTTPAPRSVVHLESSRGDPLVVEWRAGLGRVVTVTPGLGAWTTEWMHWSRWPELAGGLLEWVAASDAAGQLWTSIVDSPREVRVDVEFATDGRWSDPPAGRLRIEHPSGRVTEESLSPTAPGRLGAAIGDPAAGLYSLTVQVGESVRRVSHLRRAPRERAGPGPHADVAAWRADGLLSDWSATEYERTLAGMAPADGRPQRALLLALALFVLGLLVERARK
jgi:Mg-chelatase subunit ChlD